MSGRLVALGVTALFLVFAPGAIADPALDPSPVSAATDPPTIAAEPASIAFPATRRTKRSGAGVVFTNAGDGTVTTNGTSLSGPDAAAFSGSGCDAQILEPGESCAVTVIFEPFRVGEHNAQLVLETGGTGSAPAVPLSGTGLLDADIRLEPAAIDFGVMSPPFGSISREVLVRNVGDNAARWSLRAPHLFPIGRFTVTGTGCPQPLPAGGSCRVGLSFLPLGDGRLTGALEVLAGFAGPVLASARLSGEVRGAWTATARTVLGRALSRARDRWRLAGRSYFLRRGFLMVYWPPVDGRVTLSVSTEPRPSSGRPHRLLARTRAWVPASAEVTIRARLTSAGRALLMRPRSLRVRARLQFRTVDGQSWTVSRRLRLRALSVT